MELEKFNKVLDENYSVEFETYIGEAVALFKHNALLLISFTIMEIIVGWGITSVFVLPYGIGLLAFNVLSTFLHVGLYISIGNMRKNQEVSFANFFDGFKLNAFQIIGLTSLSVALSISMYLFTRVGVPILLGLFLYPLVAYMFSIPLFAVVQHDFWGCMELSRKIITKKWFSYFGFLLLLGLINLLGALCFVVGLLATIPLTYCAIYISFEYICRVNSVDDFDDQVANLGRPDSETQQP